MRLLWRPRAAQDFEKQIAYVEERNPAAALRLKRSIELGVELLQFFPDMGRPSRRPGIRELVVGDTPYIVVYRHTPDAVIVLRLFHFAQKR